MAFSYCSWVLYISPNKEKVPDIKDLAKTEAKIDRDNEPQTEEIPNEVVAAISLALHAHLSSQTGCPIAEIDIPINKSPSQWAMAGRIASMNSYQRPN